MTAPMDPAQMNGAPPQGPAPLEPVDRVEVAQELLRAIRAAATNVTTESNSAAEAQSWATAAKSLADAFVVLDPTLDTTGVPIVDQQVHELAMAAQEQDHKMQVERVRAQQAAPAQKRRKIKISRDNAGRATGYEEEG
jgi:hypothetical protein